MAYITLLKNVLSIILAFGVFVFVYALYYFYHSLKPPHFVTCVNPSHFGLTWENIVFNTSDGIRINGWFIPSSKALSQASGSVQEAKPSQERKAMILCHGYPFDKGNILPMFKFLHSDYDLLLFDFRAMGESDGNLSTAGYLEKEDIHSAINFLENRGFKKIGLLGLSMGGATVLMASGDPRIQTVVADSPYASMDKLLNELLHSFFSSKNPSK
jgi:pimeloyl-ACP methyl ester carboxylesterase